MVRMLAETAAAMSSTETAKAAGTVLPSAAAPASETGLLHAELPFVELLRHACPTVS